MAKLSKEELDSIRYLQWGYGCIGCNEKYCVPCTVDRLIAHIDALESERPELVRRGALLTNRWGNEADNKIHADNLVAAWQQQEGEG